MHLFPPSKPLSLLGFVLCGLLAVAYLFTWGQRYGHDSAARTQAMLIAEELAEGIRTSRVPVGSAGAASYTTKPADDVDCAAGAADPASERDCFYVRIRDRLPLGAGAITSDGDATYLITIGWADRYASRYDDDGNGLSEDECINNHRAWYEDADLNWVPSGGKPDEATCLIVQQWSVMP